MGNPAQVTRKHFRFPAYDDAVGVKLTSENRRYLFRDEPLLLQRENVNVDETFPEMEVPPAPQPVTNKQSVSGNDLKQTHTQEQIEELKRHKMNLPDYTANRSRIVEKKKKQNLFGNMHKKSKETYESDSFSTRTTGRKVTSFGDSKQTDRSYFVPTYVPASVIPDEIPEVGISDQELLDAMKKDVKSYLLLDHEDTLFREKKTEDPSVQKFNVPNELPEIPLTRRQYQQIRPSMKRFDQKEEELPRSRTELKSAKEQAKNQTAYGQKVSEAEQEQKKGVLDKPLSGMIEESHLELENNKYFT